MCRIFTGNHTMYQHFLKTLLMMVGLLAAGSASADITILVHGFDARGGNWRYAGVTRALQRDFGWHDGGHFSYINRAIVGPDRRPEGDNLFYTVDLPSHAPIPVQVDYLQAIVQSVRHFAPEEILNLVGHSAGGVAARALMVQHPEDHISRLVTIASPHLGTKVARLGALAAGTPLSSIANFFGQHQLSHSQALLSELSPQRYGNFLGWLNHQPHPPAVYISLIRVGNDNLIPEGSQDMRNVAALRGIAIAYPSPGSHSLQPSDGDILGQLLTPPKQTGNPRADDSTT